MNKGMKDSVEMKPDEACNEGEKANEEGEQVYQDRIDASKSEAVKKDLSEKPKTISTAHVIPAVGTPILMRAISCYTSMTASTRTEFVLGQSPGDRPKGVKLCKSIYDYDASSDYNKKCNGGHTEARILAELAEANQLAGARIVFNINWNDESKLPCQHCFDMICKTVNDKECGANIFICTDDNKSLDMNKECEKFKGNYQGFEDSYTIRFG
ncbi:hypothetical protein [Pragia fontium]|uniref:hypothetical protein n=1 Tax=Pragia fontium TaxID=82985 RepID=UPI00064AAE8D|nr:hypothetical protein [Pragia fontium]AKJ41632.1 hypothetical protein QQ39_05660 [Pragia fontium]